MTNQRSRVFSDYSDHCVVNTVGNTSSCLLSFSHKQTSDLNVFQNRVVTWCWKLVSGFLCSIFFNVQLNSVHFDSGYKVVFTTEVDLKNKNRKQTSNQTELIWFCDKRFVTCWLDPSVTRSLAQRLKTWLIQHSLWAIGLQSNTHSQLNL